MILFCARFSASGRKEMRMKNDEAPELKDDFMFGKVMQQ